MPLGPKGEGRPGDAGLCSMSSSFLTFLLMALLCSALLCSAQLTKLLAGSGLRLVRLVTAHGGNDLRLTIYDRGNT